MQLKFDQESSLPLAEEFLKNNPKQNGTRHLLRTAYLAKSGKGFVLDTDKFRCFIWRSNQIAVYLFEALEVYASCNAAPVIEVVLDKESKGQFFIDISESDDTVPISKNGEKSYSLGKEESSLTPQILTDNPFLSKFKPVPSTPSQAQQKKNGTVKEGTGNGQRSSNLPA